MYGSAFAGKEIPDSIIRVELISFFSKNPGLIISARELALRMNRDAEHVKRQVERLAHLRILEKGEVDGRTCYSYIPPRLNRAGKRYGLRGSDRRQKTDSERRNSCAAEQGPAMDKKHDELQTGIRLELLIAAHKTRTWKQCLLLLLDTLSHVEGASCAALLLEDKGSRVIWESRRPAVFGRPDGTANTIPDNVVIEGGLLKKGGLMDTVGCVKYLHHLNDREAVLICVFRNGSYDMDVPFLKSLFTDFMPVVEEKRRLNLISEKSAERMFKDCVYWNAIEARDMEKGLDGVLASLAKGIEADRVSLMLCNEEGCLQASSIYGNLKNHDSPRQVFPLGIGVVGWCVEHGNTANVVNTRIDPRFIAGKYDDIHSMLCCPIIMPGGERVGALCAVNKDKTCNGRSGFFSLDDMRLMEGTAEVLAHALTVKNNLERVVSPSFTAAVAS